MMTDQPIIQTQNLSKWYGEIMGVNDVTLTIKPGMTRLLGPNGAGKSTLLKLMNGQLKPNKGGLTVLGQPVWNNPELNRCVGYCPDQDTFYKFMTGFEFVCFLATLNGYSRAETEARVYCRRCTCFRVEIGLFGCHESSRDIGGY